MSNQILFTLDIKLVKIRVFFSKNFIFKDFPELKKKSKSKLFRN